MDLQGQVIQFSLILDSLMNPGKHAKYFEFKSGKTELAKAVAGECDACFVLLSPSNLLSKYVGDSERALARMFEYAKRMAPTVLFFDEIDALGMSRSADSTDQGIRRLMAELLVQFNLLKPSHRVTILAATNRIEDIDCALLRRFERRIEIGLLPDAERAKLIELKMTGTMTHVDIDFLKIARQTDGFSGADLELLCREAAMHGVRELMQNEELLRSGSPSIRPVSFDDFMLAIQAIFPSSRSGAQPPSNADPCFEGGRRQRKRSAECRIGQQTQLSCPYQNGPSTAGFKTQTSHPTS
jgi:transitional endoplasmic reticulum ATPase